MAMRNKALGNFYGKTGWIDVDPLEYPDVLFGDTPNWEARLDEVLGAGSVPPTAASITAFENQYFYRPRFLVPSFANGDGGSDPIDAVGFTLGTVTYPTTPFKRGDNPAMMGDKIKGMRGQDAVLFGCPANQYSERHDVLIITVGGVRKTYALYSEEDYTKYRNLLVAQTNAVKKGIEAGNTLNTQGGGETFVERSAERIKNQKRLKAQSRKKSAAITNDGDAVIIRNEDAQAILINNMMPLVNFNGFTHLSQGTDKHHPASRRAAENKMKMPICYVGEPEKLLSYLVNPVPMGDFVHATSAELSLLVPMIRFYFVTKGRPDKEVKFPDHTNAEMIKQLASLRESGSRSKAEEILKSRGTAGTDVGVTSLRWTYDNKHFGEHVLKLSLDLYFGTILELMNNEYLDFVLMTGTSPKGGTAIGPETEQEIAERGGNLDETVRASVENEILQEEIKQMQKQMGLGSRGSYASISTPDLLDKTRQFRELRVDVGWALPDIDDNILPDVSRNFMKSVQATQKTFKLQLMKYDLNFGDQGEATLKIDYVSSIGAYYTDPKRADVLSINEDKDVTERKEVLIPYWINDKDNLKGNTLPGGYIAKMSEKITNNLKGSRQNNLDKESVHAAEFSKTRRSLFPASAVGIDYEIMCLQKMIKVWTAHNKIFKTKFKVADDKKVSEEELTNAGFTGDPRELLGTYQTYLKVAHILRNKVDLGVSQLKYSGFIDRLFKSRKMFYCAIEQVKQGGEAPQSYKFLGYGTGNTGARGPAEVMKDVIDDMQVNKTKKKPASVTTSLGFLDPNKLGSRSDFDGIENMDSVKVFYMRLGDIIDAAMECVEKRDDATILLGSFSPHRLGIPGSKPSDYWSIADIPISIEYFGQWFLENIAQKEISQLSVKNFLDKLLLDMVTPAINEVQGDRIGDKLSFEFGILQTTIPLDNGTVITLPEIKLAGQEVTRSLNQKVYQYLVVNCGEASHTLVVNRKRDEESGIYHLVRGADRAIARRFSFTEEKMPRLRALNIEKANWAGALIIPQDCEVTLVGNNLFQNGQLVYIDASLGLGDAIAQKLKIGGYYRVVKSTNHLRAGRWDTSITCMYESAINPQF